MLLYPRIDEVNERAKAIGTSLGQLAGAVGLAKPQPYLWLRNGTQPGLFHYEAILLELERRELEAIKLLTALQARHQAEAAE